MEDNEASNQLLKNKYNLHKSREVDIAARRTQMHSGERVSQDPLARIQNYLDRFHEITDREDPREREHGLDAVKRLLYRKHIIKPDEIPESFWDNQRRIIRERGQGGDLEHVDWEELKRQNTEAIIADQRSSLDKWVDYLSSSDAPYSDALKYWSLRSVLNMGEYDKEKKLYPQRSKGTTKPFPDLNREALAYVLDAVEKKYHGQKPDENDPEFEKLLQAENFPKLYAWAIEKVTPASPEQLAATGGEWIKYDQGSSHMLLVQSLQGHGTGWCTAGESTAQTQLQGGDFHVFYSYDRGGKPIIPRVAIRMEGNKIAEVRGIAADQNLDAGAAPIVEEKLKEFPDGASYQKRVNDMETLTGIEHKTQKELMLSGEELAFLYEVDSLIEGFGYSKDPRIKEIRSQRKPYEDMPIVFGCERNQIATNARGIKSDTKAYVGRLEPGIFDILRKLNIEHIYTSFPEGKIRFKDIEIGGKNKKQLEAELAQKKIGVTDWAQSLMNSRDFTTLNTPELLHAVRLKVQDLGLPGNPTTDQIYTRAKELGLDLCPSETGPYYRLNYINQPMGEWLYIGMKQITDSLGYPDVFSLGRRGDGLWLGDYWAQPGSEWRPRREFVFSLRKKT